MAVNANNRRSGCLLCQIFEPNREGQSSELLIRRVKLNSICNVIRSPPLPGAYSDR